jgi:HEAT repeat protein
MVTFYCPNCWHVVQENTVHCPHCGVDIPFLLQARDYIDMLIAALRHPEPRTPIRVATILGNLRTPRAVEPLLDLLRSVADIYQKAAAITALGKIGDRRAEAALQQILEGGPATLRGVTQEALAELHGGQAGAGTGRTIPSSAAP